MWARSLVVGLPDHRTPREAAGTAHRNDEEIAMKAAARRAPDTRSGDTAGGEATPASGRRAAARIRAGERADASPSRRSALSTRGLSPKGTVPRCLIAARGRSKDLGTVPGGADPLNVFAARRDRIQFVQRILRIIAISAMHPARSRCRAPLGVELAFARHADAGVVATSRHRSRGLVVIFIFRAARPCATISSVSRSPGVFSPLPMSASSSNRVRFRRIGEGFVRFHSQLLH